MDSGSESDNGSYKTPQRGSNSCLPFDPSCLENIILAISDKFNFRVVMSDQKLTGAMLVTTGLSIAGGLIGKRYGGKLGAAVGGAIGGACGLGFVAISMREIWKDVKSKLSEVYNIVFDYLAGLGIEDYTKVTSLIINGHPSIGPLGMLILETTSSALGKQILSSLIPS